MINPPLTRVDVNLLGGPWNGRTLEAPRDDAGRILATIWVRAIGEPEHAVVQANPGDGMEELTFARYELESWAGENPVYQFQQ